MVKTTEIPKIDYNLIDLRSIKMEMSPPKINTKPKVENMTIDGRSVEFTNRFGNSLCSLYGFSPTIFKFFAPEEVIDRIIRHTSYGNNVRVAFETADEKTKVLAVSRPTKPYIRANSLDSMLDRLDGKDIRYHNGVITSAHSPSIGGDAPFSICGDTFFNRYIIDIPIDGYGLPSAYVSLLRQICLNGAVGYAKAFRSSIQLGTKDAEVLTTMERFIDSFNNEEGYAAIRQRFESSANSPASLDEVYSLFSLLSRDYMKDLHKKFAGSNQNPESVDSPVFVKLRELAGDICDIYGLVNLDSLSAKKRRHIPAKCTIYDLLNFSSELATHYASTDAERKIQAWIGSTISSEYDLEGTLNDDENPQDLFFKDYEDEPTEVA